MMRVGHAKSSKWVCLKKRLPLHPVVLSSLSLSATTTISMAIWVTSSQESTMGWLTMGWLWGWLKIVQHHWVKIKWNKSDPRKEHHILLGREMVNLGLTQKKSRSVKNNDWLRKWRYHWTHCRYQVFEPKMILFIILDKTYAFLLIHSHVAFPAFPKEWLWRSLAGHEGTHNHAQKVLHPAGHK